MKKPFIYGKYEKEEAAALACFEASYTGVTTLDTYISTTYGTHYDVSGTNRRGQDEHIELKLREENADKYPTAYIEPEKWQNLLRDYRDLPNKPLPIYINYIGGESNVYVWDLSRVKNAQWHASLWIDGMEQDRIGLNWKDAWHFVQEPDGHYKIVNKGK